MFEALPQRHSRIILRTADGKAEPFRKECGGAAKTARSAAKPPRPQGVRRSRQDRKECGEVAKTARSAAEPPRPQGVRRSRQYRKECGEAANTARCGGAARKTLLKKQELSFVSSAQSVDALRLPISSDPRYS